MKNKSKICFVSFGCIGIGVVLLIVGLVLGGYPGFYFNKTGIHSANKNRSDVLHVQEKIKLDKFSSIDIEVKNANLEIIPSDGYYIEYQLDGSNPKPTLEVKNQKLKFKEGSANEFLEINFFLFFSHNSHNFYVTLYVPDDKYFTFIRMVSDEGKINISDINSETMEIIDNYGQVEIESFKGQQFKIDMEDSIFKIKNLDADVINIYNEYGDCEVDTVKSQSLEARLEDGDFTVDKGDIADIKVNNEYGIVKIGLLKKLEYYNTDLKTEYGKIEVPEYLNILVNEDKKHFKSNNSAENKITVTCDEGDIIITEIK